MTASNVCEPTLTKKQNKLSLKSTSSSLSSPLPPALQCYCDRCSANSSCTTDGVCFVAIRQSDSQLTTEQRQCVNENELIPRDRPFICAPSSKHGNGIYPMCCTTDFCNKEPNLIDFPGKHTLTHAHTHKFKHFAKLELDLWLCKDVAIFLTVVFQNVAVYLKVIVVMMVMYCR